VLNQSAFGASERAATMSGQPSPLKSAAVRCGRKAPFQGMLPTGESPVIGLSIRNGS
jgi:hypothetical protein